MKYTIRNWHDHNKFWTGKKWGKIEKAKQYDNTVLAAKDNETIENKKITDLKGVVLSNVIYPS